MERTALPLDHYGDLANQADQTMSDIANQDGGVWEVKQEEFIASCMKDTGFAYYPRDVKPPARSDGSSGSGAEPGRRLWVPQLPEELADVERHGYGHSKPAEVIDNAAAAEQARQGDRNEEYVASLSESAQRQYKVALMGEALAEYDLLADFDSVPLPDLGGCMGGAAEAHPYPLMKAMDESPTTLYSDLLDRLNEEGWPYTVGYLGRTELEALDTAWRECFQADFPPLLVEPAPGVVGVEEGPVEPSEQEGPASAWGLAFHTNADGEYWDGDGQDPPVEYLSLTGAPREVAIAVADFKCREQTDYVDRFLAIQRDAQEEFIAANKAELDEMAAALEAYINGG
jgi:hypothetical protein